MRECEELLKFVQRSKDLRLDLAGGSQLQVASMPEAEVLRQLLLYRTKVPGWSGRLLTA